MRTRFATLLCLFIALADGPGGRGQEPARTPAASVATCAGGLPCGQNSLHWTHSCFPGCGCPDDYCPNPLPRQCWPPYPPFYLCVPAGDCGRPCACSPDKDKLSWWFIPTPR